MPEVPPIDTHAIEIPATASVVWEALVRTIDAELSRSPARLVARLTGVRYRDFQGVRFPETGAEILGFRVAASEPEKRLRLQGSHRFSRYALDFQLSSTAVKTQLSATTHAVFPGRVGRLYKALVIDSRGHVLVVRLLLRAIRRRAVTAQ